MKLFLDFYNHADSNLDKLKQKDFYFEILKEAYQDIDIDAEGNRLGAAGASNLYRELKKRFPVK